MNKSDLTAIDEIGSLSPEEFQELYETNAEYVNNADSEEEVNRVSDFLEDLLYWRCATDIELFARTYFSHYCRHPFNLFHYDTFESYKFGERKIRNADAAPRGFAKSTIKALIKPVHDICYELEKFIVVASNTKSQSAQKLKDISAEFLDNDDLIAAYGDMFNGKKKVAAEDYITNNHKFKTRLLAVGAGTEVRGIRFGDVRPTKIVCDDVEHSTEVENEAIRDKMEAWYKEVISKIGDENTNIEFIGTVLHRKSLLKFLIGNAKYSSRVYTAIISWSDRKDLWEEWKKIYCDLENEERREDALRFYELNKVEMEKGAEVLWPEKEPYYALMEEIIETGYRAFMKEKQNQPQSDDEKIFNPDDLHYCVLSDDGIVVESSGKTIPFDRLICLGTLDPATGQTKASANKKSDFTCLLTGYYQPSKERLFVVKDWTKRRAPTKYIQEVFNFNEKFKFYKFGVETNLYRNLLLPNILKEKERREKAEGQKIRIKFYDILQTENKEKRIYTLEPKVFHGHIVFERGLSNEFFDQLFDFPKASHDDCPDALEMLWSLARNKSGASPVNMKGIDR